MIRVSCYAHSSSNLKSYFKYFSWHYFIPDRDLRYQFVDEGMREWSGFEPEHLFGKKVTDFLGDVRFKKRQPYFNRAFPGERVKFVELLDHKL